jgi:hypothetical protein
LVRSGGLPLLSVERNGKMLYKAAQVRYYPTFFSPCRFRAAEENLRDIVLFRQRDERGILMPLVDRDSLNESREGCGLCFYFI